MARFNSAGVVYHVISRFVDRHWFLHGAEEREVYLRMLAASLRTSDWRCFAYALMSNHIHLGMIAGELPLASWAKLTNSPFANWMNRRHGRLGPVFAGRPSDWARPHNDVAELIAYIHNNPVRAGVVQRASDSNWTSHRAYIGATRAPAWLDIAQGLALARIANGADLDVWVRTSTTTEPLTPDLRRMRREARRLGPLELATPTVRESVEVPLVVRPGTVLPIAPLTLIAAVSKVTRLEAGEFCSRTARVRSVSARKVAVHAAKRLRMTLAATAGVLGISVQAASKLGFSTLTKAEEELVAGAVREVALTDLERGAGES